jgi:hypothetical protein
MTATLPALERLRPNPSWASLPLFDRTGWKRVRFGDVVENCAETCEPEEAGVGAVCGDGAFGAGVAACAELGECGGWDDIHAAVSGDIYVLAPKDTQRLLPELLPLHCLSERFFQHADAAHVRECLPYFGIHATSRLSMLQSFGKTISGPTSRISKLHSNFGIQRSIV